MPQSLADQVILEVARAGAVTTRRMINQYGPKPNWIEAIRSGMLKEAQTDYGAVLTVSPAGRRDFHDMYPQTVAHIPYIRAAGAAADRAFQMDAVAHLAEAGYTVAKYWYKKSRKNTKNTRPILYTDQIVCTVLRVPEPLMALLESQFGGIARPYQPDRNGVYEPALGHLTLYASVSNGGIGLSRLRALCEHHGKEFVWVRGPLLVAVPDVRPLAAYERQINERHRAGMAEEVARRPAHLRYIPDRLKLLALPLPKSDAPAPWVCDTWDD